MIAINYKYKIPLEVLNNQVFVKLYSVDNSRQPMKPLTFLLDTGAFMTTMEKEKAVKRGFKVSESKALVIGGFGGGSILCDLRVIPTLVFCGFQIKNALVATPNADNIAINEVVGMNILENFQLGIDFALSELYANIRGKYVSQKPKYQCGEVSLMDFEEFLLGRI
ncbi:MAG: retropepsin-like domain-containing protein [Turicibacter sp.]|nr:retropepsin-like domain-containing protein [Turicibacter sp.]